MKVEQGRYKRKRRSRAVGKERAPELNADS
jgi:hypothetical protein